MSEPGSKPRSADAGARGRSAMDARRLLHWGDLEERRRRAARRGLSRLHPIVFSAAAAVALALLVARGMRLLGDGISGDATPLGASALWLAAVAASHTVVLLGAPFRMFWRRDAALVGRLAIPGRAAFSVALIRGARATALVFLPCAAAAMTFAIGEHGSVDIALRHLLLAGIAALAAGLLGPAAALAGGAVVASDQAHRVLGGMGGEFQAPRSSWLGLLPGTCGAALTLALIACASWAQGGGSTAIGSPPVALAICAAVPLGAFALAWPAADRVMLAAMREVSALDTERLAHVELTGPSPLERAVAGRLGAGGRRVFHKDASLSRRRYPIPFFLGFVGMVSLWGLAVAMPESALSWAGVIAAGLGAYGVVMARRLVVPPIEYRTYLRTLPIAAIAATRAKQARSALWIAVYIGLGAAPLCARSGEPLVTAGVLGAIAIASLAVAVSALRALHE